MLTWRLVHGHGHHHWCYQPQGCTGPGGFQGGASCRIRPFLGEKKEPHGERLVALLSVRRMDSIQLQ